MKKSMIARREATRERLAAYLERRVLPALGLRGVAYRLSVPPDGTRSVVLFLETDRRRFVVKCYDDLLRAARTASAMRHMAERDAPTPRLLYSDLSPWTRLRVGCGVLVEEAIDGRNLYEVPPTAERLRVAAAALARLHAITRDAHGALFPGGSRRGPYFDVMHRRLERRVEHLASRSPHLGAVRELAPWLRARRDVEDMQTPYSLCHLRVTDTNVLLGDAGEAWLIDVVTARYALAAVDLERALHRWCEDDPALGDAFLDEYFRRQDVLRRDAWVAHRAYFHASFHLTQAYRAGKVLAKALRSGHATSKRARRGRRRLLRHVEELVEVLRDAPRGPGEATCAAILDGARRFAEAGAEPDDGGAAAQSPGGLPAGENT